MSADPLDAGTVFEVKCLFAIDAIAAVYRADPASWDKIMKGSGQHLSLQICVEIARQAALKQPYSRVRSISAG